MKLDMIILREMPVAKGRRRGRDTVLVGVTRRGNEARTEFAVEVKETTDEERLALRSEVGVIAAPPMPVVLIKSFQNGAAVGGQPPKLSWGISAVNPAVATGQPNEPFTGKGVTVAVLDTGIDAEHSAFKGIELITENFVDGEPAHDTDGHGTHCAGTIFGRDVDGCRIGIARGVSKAVVGKVIGKDGGSTEQIVKAITWALSKGARVISLSLGLDFVGYQKILQTRYKMPEQQATAFALAGYRDNIRLFDKLSGVTSSNAAIVNSAVVAAAAGNESKRPDYSIIVSPPAAAEYFLSVAALGPGGGKLPLLLADFSNSGAMFAAPGVDIWSAKKGGGLVAMSGTSQATPHVAGVAALWVEKLINEKKFSAARVIELMKEKCIPLAPAIAEDDVRYGLVQGPAQ
jgi:subtilisin family serine protease